MKQVADYKWYTKKTGSQFRPCSLAGTVEQIKAAKGQLDEIVNRGMDKDQHRVTNPGLLGQGGVNETASSMAVAAARAAQEAAAAAFSGQVAPQCTETMIIPANKCGLIIGRNGDTIKNMQMQYKVKMMMIQEDAQTGMDKPLKISGTANSVNNAKMAVLNLVHGQSDGKMQPGMSRGIQSSIMSINTGEMFENLPAPRPITNGMEVFVLQKAVGVIIGKQGEMISKIQRDSGCRIQFTPEDHKQPYRTCVVTGSADGVQVALAQIDDICKNVDQNGPGGADVGGGGGGGRHHDRHEFELSIPSKKVGLIIGKGGESLKYIAHKTGSKIIVDNDHPKEDKYNKIMIITASSEDQAEHARDLIMDRGRLRDSEVRFHKLKSRRPTSHSNHPQNAPGISTNPVALQPNPFGMPNSSPATLNPWASHMSQQTTDSQQQTAVQQYYSQYFASIAQQQALQQQQQAQQKQQQQEGSSPAGGAPAQDYSQQWAEYFKKMNELTKQQEYVAYFQEFYKQSQQLGQPMGQSSDGQNPQ